MFGCDQLALHNRLNIRLGIPSERRKCEDHATRVIQKVWRKRLRKEHEGEILAASRSATPQPQPGDNNNEVSSTTTDDGGGGGSASAAPTPTASSREAEKLATAVQLCKRNVLRVAHAIGVESDEDMSVSELCVA